MIVLRSDGLLVRDDSEVEDYMSAEQGEVSPGGEGEYICMCVHSNAFIDKRKSQRTR
jgi:hypothetical protein